MIGKNKSDSSSFGYYFTLLMWRTIDARVFVQYMRERKEKIRWLNMIRANEFNKYRSFYVRKKNKSTVIEPTIFQFFSNLILNDSRFYEEILPADSGPMPFDWPKVRWTHSFKTGWLRRRLCATSNWLHLSKARLHSRIDSQSVKSEKRK